MRVRRDLLRVLTGGALALALAAAPPARAKDPAPPPAKNNTAVDVKEVGRNIGQLGKEIKEAGQKLGDGVKEGSGGSKPAPKHAARKPQPKKAKTEKPAETSQAPAR